jgi:guanylate kinase
MSVADPGTAAPRHKRRRRVAGQPGAMLVVLSGPSGVGKDAVISALRRRPEPREMRYVVTYTTRARRPGETDAVSYHFVDPTTFEAMRAAGELLEASEVHGHWYGTPRNQVVDALTAGHDVILKIDVQGARFVRRRVPRAVLIFIVPPSPEDLEARLKGRATETADELALRQRNALMELARQGDYDYIVVNETGQVDRTAARIEEIIAAEHRADPERRVMV